MYQLIQYSLAHLYAFPSKIVGGKFKTPEFFLVGDGETIRRLSPPFPRPRYKLLDRPMLRFFLLVLEFKGIRSPSRGVNTRILRTQDFHNDLGKDLVEPRSLTTKRIWVESPSATRA
mmetsp:Transcript_6667/g.11844  ORF Transcript_6667/g.11844 Transcript_6667/m.11844 type:complete len:117 (-) Transcript_6667:1489-1839(-)